MEVPEHTAWDLEAKAEEVLNRCFGSTCWPPIDVDLVAESLGIELVDCPGLKDRWGVSGLLARSGEQYIIWMDRDELDSNSKRSRFTVAEEVGHFVLHRDYFPQTDNVAEAITAYLATPNHDRIDRNAKRFAAALLMPGAQVEREAEALYATLIANPLGTLQQLQATLARSLAQLFEVNVRAMQFRLTEKFPNRRESIVERIEQSFRARSSRLR